ncbi:MAG: transcription termination factor Rho [Chloroflexi bacterium]|nr:transcription termination factor Rho [Chloroflexota bacterium]
MQQEINVQDLESKSREELAEIARELGIQGHAALKKEDLIFKLTQRARTEQPPAAPLNYLTRGGVLEIVDEGYGFLRTDGLRPGLHDVYVSQSQIRRFGLRTGDYITGQTRPPKDGEKYYGLLRVESVNDIDPEQARSRPYFDSLTPIFPRVLINLETAQQNISQRMINLLSPIGRGQRGMIVSPPKAGKTMLLKQIADGVITNYLNDIHLMIVLTGERPEEVTDWKRTVPAAEVFSSTFDEPVEDHTRVAELSLERAKRLVEGRKDVVILLDSITRLTRAYNLSMPPSGRTLSGGIDPVALYPPKRFFGAARNVEEGGSLTIMATCLIDTGSRMDEVIYEEFKGTGNMELHLDRKLAEKRIFPAIDIQRSGTRREELLLEEGVLQKVWLLRRMVAIISQDAMHPTEAAERVITRMAKTANNVEFLATLSKGEV